MGGKDRRRVRKCCLGPCARMLGTHHPARSHLLTTTLHLAPRPADSTSAMVKPAQAECQQCGAQSNGMLCRAPLMQASTAVSPGGKHVVAIAPHSPTAAALCGHGVQALQRGVERVQGQLGADKCGQLGVLPLPDQPQRGHSHRRRCRPAGASSSSRRGGRWWRCTSHRGWQGRWWSGGCGGRGGSGAGHCWRRHHTARHALRSRSGGSRCAATQCRRNGRLQLRLAALRAGSRLWHPCCCCCHR